MSEWKWFNYSTNVPVDPENCVTPHQDQAVVLYASCCSRNGYYGCVWIIQNYDNTYSIKAGSQDTGNLWKSPDAAFNTLNDAVRAAQLRWRPV